MPVTLICQYAPCSKPFIVDTYLKDSARFCSNPCRYAERSVHNQTLPCMYCGTLFTVRASRADKAIFCSTPCHDNWRSDQHVAQFWEKVMVCGHGLDCPFCCWPWKGMAKNRYGVTYVHNKAIGTHRQAWQLWNKRTMPSELEAAHYCHFRPCCNPMHLHPATTKENFADSVRDHRIPSGDDHHNSKLTRAGAIEALRLKISGWSNTAIAKHLSVSKTTIQQLMAGNIWKDVPRPAVIPRQKPPGRRGLVRS